MSLSQLRNVNFGRLKAGATGPTGVGYTLLNTGGAVAVARTTVGVYESAPGIYAAYVSFPDGFHGQILWDTGTAFPTTYYAADQYNVEENDPKVSNIDTNVSIALGDLAMISTTLDVVSGNIDVIKNDVTYISGSVPVIKAKIDNVQAVVDRIYDIEYGRWHIVGNQMIFYKTDNATEVARFNLFDETGTPASDSVFQRVKV